MYFQGSEAKIVLGVLFAIYLISEMMISGAKRAGGHSGDRPDDRGSSRWFELVFPLGWWIGIGVALIPGVWSREAYFGSAPVFGVGAVLMIGGLLLRWWSVATLGRLFTVNVAIRAGHRLVDSGPYRYVRHPAYTAILLIQLGTALCLGNLLSLIVLVVPVFAALCYRMRVEEDVLLSGLGQPYRDYMARTKRLIPGVY
ncbi:MAG: isoprenylcysteine carboxylmethyltransferase family protein [Steroidobacteraceae bacterium]